MTTTNGRALETIEGVADAVNDTGVRIDGSWYNRSKFKPIELPPAGARIRLKVDSKGYIRDLEVLESATASVSQPNKDERITRLTVLKAAASFAAGRDDIKSGDVLRIADSWLAWVER